ncbi:helix-turn-helix domain-containing protein [Pseudonocardia sp. D17]|uniref:helix-turn-helix domain-containing protein n=1 Tax=Pseudonocardia sp. D17 TaxID=882661 RepID=UPI002B38F5AA|nr:transcriptional regulator [Pseudonocardia sp. D17]
MTSDRDPTLSQQQRWLAARLKQLRLDAGLSAEKLGSRLGWSQSKTSKIENGRTPPSVDAVRSWLDQCRADDELRVELLDAARELTTRVQTWRQLHRAGPADQQRVRAARDAETTGLGIYQSEVVPGLLQVPEYTRRMLEVHSQVPAADIPAMVAARLSRQAILFDDTKTFDIVITEQAARWRPGSIATTLAQLDRLATLAQLPNVSIGIVTREAQETAPLLHSFVISRYPDGAGLVEIETLTAEQTVAGPVDVARYEQFLRDQQERAVHGTDLRALLDALAADLRSRQS